MIENVARLNDNDTTVKYFTSSYFVKSLITPTLQICTSSITSYGSIRNLGITLDKYVNMYKMSH